MFPIPSGRKLSFIEIARYWSREIKPSASPDELRTTLGKAWWRGELAAANGPSRLNLLRAIYSTCEDYIEFVIPDLPAPPTTRLLDNGDIEVFRLVRLPLPNPDPGTWTEANSAEAFEAVADSWNEEFYSLVAPVIKGIVLTRSEFFQWIGECQYQSPTFWGSASGHGDKLEHTDNSAPRMAITEIEPKTGRGSKASKDADKQESADNLVPRIKIPDIQPKTLKSSAAWFGIKAIWPNGPSQSQQTADIHRLVNKWIEKQPRTLYPFAEVSRETVARLLRRK
jgi:hypothetical protein